MSEQQLIAKAPIPSGANVGAISIEKERAISEVEGQLILAKRFPRDLTLAHAELMEACKLPSLASVAFYSVPRKGGVVSGPSIRLAEEIARVCGNIEYGHRELSRSEGKSEIEVYAWDKQTNTRSVRQLTVMHIMDTKDGPRKLRDQKDVDDMISNKASKQLRGRILAIVPKWLVEAATLECKKTIAGNNEKPISVRVRDMAQAFVRFGVTTVHLSEWLGHALDMTTLDELVDLTGIYNALKDGAKASEYFGSKDDPVVNPDNKALENTIAQVAQNAPVQVQNAQANQTPRAQKKQPTVEPKAEEKVLEPVQVIEKDPEQDFSESVQDSDPFDDDADF